MRTRRPGTASEAADWPWLELFLDNRDALLAFLRQRVGPRHQAVDLLQDVYIRLSRTDVAAAEIDNPRAYMFRTAANLAIDVQRADRARAAEIQGLEMDWLRIADDRPDALQTAIDRQTLRRLDEALAAMPEETRAMIYMIKIDRLSYGEVAKLFAVSKSTVEKRIAKALRKCKSVIVDD